jgi:hypothetical protein
MTQDTFVTESNIFGQTVTTPNSGQFATAKIIAVPEDSADDMLNAIAQIAGENIASARNRADWLSFAANSGQNADSNSLVNRQMALPGAVDGATVLSGWTLPTMPTLPSLPTLPDNLKIDFAKLKIDVDADIEKLQDSWMAQYLPAVTDVSALNSLVNNVLNGSSYNSAVLKLNDLEASLRVSLNSITDTTLVTLTAAITTTDTNRNTNIAAARAGITDALALAGDNVQDIAWNKGRDQVAREAARQESEAVSAWAARGFSLPGGVLTAQIQKARQATLNSASEFAATQAEKMQQAFLEIARNTIDSWLRTMDAQNTAELASYRAIMDARFKTAELDLDASKTKAKQAFDHLGLTLDFSKFAGELATKYRLGVMSAMNDLIRAYAALMGNELEYINSIAKAEQNAQAAVVDYYRAALASAQLGINLKLSNNENDLKFSQIAAQFIGQAVGHHVQAASSAASVFGQIAGHALGGLNGIASKTVSL